MSARATGGRGLPPSFTGLYAENYEFLWRCARRLGVGNDEIEDVVQDSFVIALRRYDEFDHEAGARASSWLFAILRNVARNRGRGERRRRARLDAYASTPRSAFTPPNEGTEAQLARALLDEFLDTLDEQKRAAFILAELEGMTGPELARATGLNLNTANSRLRAARRAFRSHFEEPRATLSSLRRGARRERPAAGAQARSLPAIALAAGYELGASASLGVGLGLLSSKLIAGLIAIASLVGAGMIVTATPDPATPARAHASETGARAQIRADARPRPRAAAFASPTLEARSVVDAPAPPPSPRSAKRPRAPESSDLSQLGDAREALLAGDARRALALLADLDLDAPLDGHRVALQVTANCELGQVEAARALTRSWLAHHPDDPISAQLGDVCESRSR